MKIILVISSEFPQNEQTPAGNTYLLMPLYTVFLGSWELFSQSKNPPLLWNTNVHYHVHKSLPLDPILT